MSLQSCPKCGNPVSTYGRFMIEPIGFKKFHCSKCNSALSQAWLYGGLPIIVFILLGVFLLRNLPSFKNIPFGIVVVMTIVWIIVTYVSIKSLTYFFGTWKVADK